MSRVTDERQAAFAVLRRTFEKDEFTEVAFRDEAERRASKAARGHRPSASPTGRSSARGPRTPSSTAS